MRGLKNDLLDLNSAKHIDIYSLTKTSWSFCNDMVVYLCFVSLANTTKKYHHIHRLDDRELRKRALSKSVLMSIAAHNSSAQTSDLDI